MKRNITLDYYKILMSILIIIIHIPPLLADSWLFSWFFSYGITRIAVPTFFLINGYFIAPKISDSRLVKKYLKHLVIIYSVWYIIYIPYDNFVFILNGHHSIVYNIINSYLTGFLHLWYIPALIVGVICLHLAKKYLKKDKIILTIACLIFIAATVSTLYIWQVKIFRNGITMGFPFVAIGYWIYKYKIVERSKNIDLIPIAILSFAVLMVETYFKAMHIMTTDLAFSLLICCPALLILVLKHSHFSDKYNIYMSQMSAGIYFVHLMVVFYIVPISENSLYKLPLVVLVSALLSAIIIFANKRIKILL